MKKRIKILTFITATLLFLTQNIFAQTEGNAAFVFGYYPDEGQRALFNEGYRRHLNWHEEHNDPLPWYGWYVTSGERIGMFIDGSFGIPFEAFDHRVDISGDAADAAKNVSPFSKPVFRRTYALRKDLSTGAPLENLQPYPHVQIFFYKLKAGTAPAFERVLQELRPILKQTDKIPTLTWYELIVGGSHSTYILMVHRNGWSSYGSFRETIATVIAKNFNTNKANNLLSVLSESVVDIRSEVWAYRSDMSLLPNE